MSEPPEDEDDPDLLGLRLPSSLLQGGPLHLPSLPPPSLSPSELPLGESRFGGRPLSSSRLRDPLRERSLSLRILFLLLSSEFFGVILAGRFSGFFAVVLNLIYLRESLLGVLYFMADFNLASE